MPTLRCRSLESIAGRCAAIRTRANFFRLGLWIWTGMIVAIGGNLLAQAKLEISFLDEPSGDPVAARLTLQDAKRSFKPKNALTVGRNVLVEGTTQWSPPIGTHRFLLERGPEYDRVEGEFTIEKNAEDQKKVTIEHRNPLRKEGWYSGDLLSMLPVSQLKRWQQAEGLDFTSSQASPNDAKSPTARPNPAKSFIPPGSLDACIEKSYWDRRPGSGLVLHRWSPTDPPDEKLPSSQLLVEAKSSKGTIAEIQALWARDVPIWLASRRIDLVQLLSPHSTPESPMTLQGIRNPDSVRFSGVKGLGRLVEHIYWQMLEAGFQIPPSAGSGFGAPKVDTHLGYNRVYVQMDAPASLDEWWTRLLFGRTFVTNGPLLRAQVLSQYPGETFRGIQGQKIELNIDLKLAVRDRVEYLDVIYNGRTLYQARLEEHVARGEFPPLFVNESGWLVIRVVTEYEKSYRLATTAPYYFELGGQSRISRKAVRFFQEWLEQSAKEIEKETSNPEAHRPYIEAAREFWKLRMDSATVD